jgi:hypothetical protein
MSPKPPPFRGGAHRPSWEAAEGGSLPSRLPFSPFASVSVPFPAVDFATDLPPNSPQGRKDPASRTGSHLKSSRRCSCFSMSITSSSATSLHSR